MIFYKRVSSKGDELRKNAEVDVDDEGSPKLLLPLVLPLKFGKGSTLLGDTW
jgi:hypothetical protein